LVLVATTPCRSEAPKSEATPRTDLNGDPLPELALARFGSARLRHGDVVTGLLFSGDGKTIVSASRDRTIRFWNSTSGKELGRFTHTHEIMKLIASASGKFVVAIGNEARDHLFVLDIAARKAVFDHEFSRLVHSAGLSDDSEKLLVWDDDNKISTIEVESGKVLKEVPLTMEGKATRAAFSPNAGVLAVNNGKTLLLFDTNAGDRLQSIDSGRLDAITFAPDCKTLLTTSQSGKVILWDVKTGKLRHRFHDNLEGPPASAFSANGKLMMASGGTFRINYDGTIGKRVESPNLGSYFVDHLAYSPDGKILAGAGDGRRICLWDTETAKVIEPDETKGHLTAVRSVAMSSDGKVVATGSDNARLWDAVTGKLLRTFETPDWLAAADLSRDGRLLMAAEIVGGMRLWDVETGKVLWKIPRQDEGNRLAIMTSDRRVLSLGKDDGYVQGWQPSTGKEVTAFTVQEAERAFLVLDEKITPDGRRLVVRNNEGAVCVWDVTRAVEIARFVTGDDVLGCALSNDGRTLALASSENSIDLFEVLTGKKRAVVKGTGPSHELAFSPDDRVLLTADNEKYMMRLWDLRGGVELLKLKGHDGPCCAVRFSADGMRLLTGSLDGTALLWDIRKGVARPGPQRKLNNAELDERWNDLAGDDAMAANNAIQDLCDAPDASLEFLASRLKAPTVAGGKRIARLIANLDSEDFTTRQSATDELANIADEAEPYLRKAIEVASSLENRKRLNDLLQKLKSRGNSPRQRRILRGVEVLERIGNDESRKLASRVAGDAAPQWLKDEVKAMLERRSTD
jgi:WD40 repeat protein